jgi:hypothetical protein
MDTIYYFVIGLATWNLFLTVALFVNNCTSEARIDLQQEYTTQLKKWVERRIEYYDTIGSQLLKRLGLKVVSWEEQRPGRYHGYFGESWFCKEMKIHTLVPVDVSPNEIEEMRDEAQEKAKAKCEKLGKLE